MAACKSMTDAAHGVPGSSMVTAMARNGVNFGIRLSAAPATRWFQAPANPVDGLYFPGYSRRRRRRRPRRLGHHRDQRARRLRDGGLAGDRPVRRRHAGRRDCATAGGCCRITLGAQSRVHAAGAQLRRHAAGHRRAARSSIRGVLPIINTGIAHREAGRRPDRRRDHRRRWTASPRRSRRSLEPGRRTPEDARRG